MANCKQVHEMPTSRAVRGTSITASALLSLIVCFAVVAESDLHTGSLPPAGAAAEQAVPGPMDSPPVESAGAAGDTETDAAPEAAVAGTSPAGMSGKTEAKEISRDEFRPQDKELTGRAEARWQSLVKGDFEAAFGYTLPSYRQTHTLEQFRNSFGKAVTWILATVQGIRYDTPEIAHVRLNLEYEYVPSWGGQAEKMVTQFHETWLHRDGEWWLSVSK
jgi:hypothetical protein